jgi:drug/metabolite transporter (DMT)-like permease
MPFGLLTGLTAALSWGTMDIATALASRRVGSLLVTAGVVGVSAIWLVVIALPAGISGGAGSGAIGPSVMLGFIGAGAYFAYFTGLRVGPISVVSGMVAAYGGLTVVLSVVLRGETLTTTQALGATVATVGVILTGVAFEGGFRGTRFAGPGVVFAVVALVLFALMAITTDIALETASPLLVLLVSRVVTAVLAIAIIVALTVRRGSMVDPAVVGESGPVGLDPVPEHTARRLVLPNRRSRIVGAIVFAGTLDLIGLAAFTIGLQTAPTWMVGLASSFGPAVTIVAAVALLGERLKPIQWLGLVGVAIGMVAIALP